MARAGKFDRRIVIRRATVSYSAFNEPVETFADYLTVWAECNDVSAGESWRSAEIGAEISTRFKIRWSQQTADINPRDRILFDNVEYNIVAVRDQGRRLTREIDAVARAESRTDGA